MAVRGLEPRASSRRGAGDSVLVRGSGLGAPTRVGFRTGRGAASARSGASVGTTGPADRSPLASLKVWSPWVENSGRGGRFRATGPGRGPWRLAGLEAASPVRRGPRARADGTSGSTFAVDGLGGGHVRPPTIREREPWLARWRACRCPVRRGRASDVVRVRTDLVQGPRPGRRLGPSRGATETSGTGGDAVQVPRPKSCFPSLHPSPFSIKGFRPTKFSLMDFCTKENGFFSGTPTFSRAWQGPLSTIAPDRTFFPDPKLEIFGPDPKGPGYGQGSWQPWGRPSPSSENGPPERRGTTGGRRDGPASCQACRPPYGRATDLLWSLRPRDPTTAKVVHRLGAARGQRAISRILSGVEERPLAGSLGTSGRARSQKDGSLERHLWSVPRSKGRSTLGVRRGRTLGGGDRSLAWAPSPWVPLRGVKIWGS